MRRIAFINGSIFNSDTESFYRANVVCEDGFITDIINYTPNDAEIVDIRGKYLIPGLVDVHSHGIMGSDFNSANEADVAKMCRSYAKFGTTSIMATLASYPMSKLINSIFAINANRLNTDNNGAHIVGIHLEGRYLNPEKKGAHNEELLANPSLSELEDFVRFMMPAPMHFSLAPELEGAEQFIRRAKEFGATVGIAHTNATYEQACDAIAWGADSFTHTFNAMSPIHHRMPGATTCALTTDSAFAEVICDGKHLHPAIVKLIYKSKPKDKMVLVTDSMEATGLGDGVYEICGLKVTVKNGTAVNENGVLAGSTLTLFEAVTNLMKFCNIPLEKALRYATVNPAKMVGADFVGKIEKCYRADFITIDNLNDVTLGDVYIGARKQEK
ncbi:MAG: N-acetylglucosamine-6-phosphate deacetylase [Clostridia bacterium]|nr:N-acetylglucosamine-6-phosphate deacetylase [Clostridia bacterium]